MESETIERIYFIFFFFNNFDKVRGISVNFIK